MTPEKQKKLILHLKKGGGGGGFKVLVSSGADVVMSIWGKKGKKKGRSP